jgi:hypothetical protein
MFGGGPISFSVPPSNPKPSGQVYEPYCFYMAAELANQAAHFRILEHGQQRQIATILEGSNKYFLRR